MYAFQSQSSNLPWKKNAMSRLLRVMKVVKLMLSHPNQNIAKLKVDERQLLPMWDALFDWFIGISGIFESSLAKKDVQDAMQNFLRTVACTTVSKSSRRQKKKKKIALSNRWIQNWMSEYGVSLRHPNKRFQIKQIDREERGADYLKSIWTVWKFFLDNYTFFYKKSIFDPRPENCLSFSTKLPQKDCLAIV